MEHCSLVSLKEIRILYVHSAPDSALNMTESSPSDISTDTTVTRDYVTTYSKTSSDIFQ